MRLITENGQLDLPTDFAFEISQNSPVFSYEGTQSVPTNLPTSARNLAALGFPTRLARTGKYKRKFSAILDAGVYQKAGQLIIDTAEKKAGIVGAVMLNESDMYSRIKDVKLTEVFEKIVRNDYSGTTDPVSSWYNHIFSCMTGVQFDDFTAFPVAVNFNEQTGYEVLNCPDHTSGSDPWALKWAARDIVQGSETISVPSGYGVTPFLFLYRVLELLFAEYGYTVNANPFKDNALLKKVVILNNTADTLCKGVINYSDLVPSCTISEFLKFIENKFLTHVYIKPDSKTVDIIPLEAVLSGDPDIDLSERINGEISYIFTDTKEVDISSVTALEGAAPAAVTIFDLGKKYATMVKIDEQAWQQYDWGSCPPWENNLVIRKATGHFYDIHFRRVGGPTNATHLGTNYFRYFTNKQQAREYKSIDMMPPMVEVILAEVNLLEVRLLCPYIGESRHINTVYNDSPDSAEQKIIVVYSAGRAAELALPAFNTVHKGTIAAKYYLGTTQKYDNSGAQWCSYDLTTTDIYKLFFKKWNAVIRNCGTQIECRVDYTDTQLLSLKLERLKMLRGQLLLPESLSFNVSRYISHNSSRFLLIKNMLPITDDEVMPFST
jgi:hypothetical protein